MLKRIFIAMFISTLLSAGAQTIEEKPAVTFQVTAEKEIEADKLILFIKIEKKDKNFKNGSAAVSYLSGKLTDALKKAGLKADEIVTDKLNSTPDSTWWSSKEYTVTLNIKVIIKNTELIPDVFTAASSIDQSITIAGFDYDYSGVENVKSELILAGARSAEKYKLAYENGYGVKLKIASVNANDEFGGSGAMMERSVNFKLSAADMPQPEFNRLPVKTFRMNFFVKYYIVQ